jgi:hypothetical protein
VVFALNTTYPLVLNRIMRYWIAPRLPTLPMPALEFTPQPGRLQGKPLSLGFTSVHGTHCPLSILKGNLHPHVHPLGESCCPLVTGKNSASDPLTFGAFVQGLHWVRYDVLLSG